MCHAADLRIFLTLDGALPGGIIRRTDDLLVHGKADLRAEKATGLSVSGVSGLGIPDLLDEIATALEARVANAAVLTHARHREGALDAISALVAAQSEVRLGALRAELAAENLRKATRSLDALVGRVDVEILLDEIFSSFCIGK